jgi:hypothetical protein
LSSSLFVGILAILIYIYSSKKINWTRVNRKNHQQLADRLEFIVKIFNSIKYRTILILPPIGILLLLLSMDVITHNRVVFILCFIFLTYFIYKVTYKAKDGDITLSLSAHWDIGYKKNKSLSLHLAKTNIDIFETLELIDLFAQEKISRIEFKSFLLHEAYDPDQRWERVLINKFHAHSWKYLEKETQNTDMKIESWVAIKLKIFMGECKKWIPFLQYKRVNLLNKIPMKERTVVFEYTPDMHRTDKSSGGVVQTHLITIKHS